MNDGGADGGLLQVARKALLDEVLPALDGAARYQALMIARAMAIAQRQAELGAEAERQELAGLESLLEGTARPAPGSPLDAYRRALCMEIRNGRFDARGPGREALLSHLAVTTENRLRIDNPRLLDKVE